MNNTHALQSYQDPSDLGLIPQLAASAPVEAAAFLAFNASAERSDGIIPPKYRELISIGVALATQCSYCLDVHTRRALAAGATRSEIGEATFVTAAVRAGAALGHGLLVQKILDAVEHAK
jgi:AhpD family alkylhydroperoxidase